MQISQPSREVKAKDLHPKSGEKAAASFMQHHKPRDLPDNLSIDVIFLNDLMHDTCRYHMVCMLGAEVAVFRDISLVVKRSNDRGILPAYEHVNHFLQTVKIIGCHSIDGGDILDLVLIELLQRNLTCPTITLTI